MELARVKRDILQAWEKRLGFVVTTVNLSLCAAALHPAYGHLEFIDDTLREKLFDEMTAWVLDWSHLGSNATRPQQQQSSSSSPTIVVSRRRKTTVRETIDDMHAAFCNDLPPAVKECGEKAALAPTLSMALFRSLTPTSE